VVGVITVGHGHEDDHVYDHHRSPRLGTRLDHGKASSSEAVRPFRLAVVGLQLQFVAHVATARGETRAAHDTFDVAGGNLEDRACGGDHVLFDHG